MTTPLGVAVGTDEGTIRIFDTRKLALVHEIGSLKNKKDASLKLVSIGNLLLSSTMSNQLLVYDLTNVHFRKEP